MLSLGGVILVLLSIVCSIGIYGYIGVPATLIIFEILPFLVMTVSDKSQKISNFVIRTIFIFFKVLAVGVDNIFIIVETFQKIELSADEDPGRHMGRVLAECAPSMFVSTASQVQDIFI